MNLGDLPRDVLEPMADALVKHVHEEEADVDPHQVVEEVRRLVDQLQQYLSVYTLQELCEDYEDYEEAQQHPQHLTAFVAMGVSSRSAPEPPERRQEMAHEIFRLADKYKIPAARLTSSSCCCRANVGVRITTTTSSISLWPYGPDINNAYTTATLNPLMIPLHEAC